MKLSGERLTTRLRVQLFKAMLHNDVEWYDDEEHTTGSLNAMLYIDANNVKAVSFYCHRNNDYNYNGCILLTMLKIFFTSATTSNY